MKHIIGKERRQEGDRYRLFTVIQCDSCGRKTYERKAKKIQECLDAHCIHCKPKQPPVIEYGDYVQDERTLHPLYSRYVMMRERCYNPNHKSYPCYGGRGIEVCLRWMVDFWAFVDDLEAMPGYNLAMEMDRIDNDGPYDPLNVRMVPKEINLACRGGRFTPRSPSERAQGKREYRRAYHRAKYRRRPLGWWRENFNLKHNPYIYGPMPWKHTSAAKRKAEAIERGWYKPFHK